MRLMMGLGVVICLLTFASCNVAGWALQGLGDGPGQDQLASYEGLDGKEVAVIVSADEAILYAFPAATDRVAQALSRALAQTLPTVRVVHPRDVQRFQQAQPYWVTLSSVELAQRLNVQRIVHVEIMTYRTNEPGNSHVWQGTITSQVRVIEQENPATPAFGQAVEARFPENTAIGMIDADQVTIEMGMLKTFTDKTVKLFKIHKGKSP